MHFSTRAVHAGHRPDPVTGALQIPIFESGAFLQEAVEKGEGSEFLMPDNPTRTALEAKLAALEGARFAVTFSSGSAAINILMHMLASGDHVVAGNISENTFRLLKGTFAQFDISLTCLDITELSALEQALRPETKMLWIESPSCPLLRITDFAQVVELAKEYEILSVADSTLATPFLQQPLKCGFDMVIHSTTEYLSGHLDAMGGAILTNREDLKERLTYYQTAVGAMPSPFDCWLILRGTRTLSVRMERHCSNAMAVAKFLREHPKVKQTYYPGLPECPGHEIACRQMEAFGGVVAFELKGGLEAAQSLVSSMMLFTVAQGIGGVESLIAPPLEGCQGTPERQALPEGLVRLSVGIEDIQDIIEDLSEALHKIP